MASPLSLVEEAPVAEAPVEEAPVPQPVASAEPAAAEKEAAEEEAPGADRRESGEHEVGEAAREGEDAGETASGPEEEEEQEPAPPSRPALEARDTDAAPTTPGTNRTPLVLGAVALAVIGALAWFLGRPTTPVPHVDPAPPVRSAPSVENGGKAPRPPPTEAATVPPPPPTTVEPPTTSAVPAVSPTSGPTSGPRPEHTASAHSIDDESVPLTTRVMRALEANQASKAVQLATQLTSKSPGSASAWQLRGAAEQAAGRGGKGSFKRCAELAPPESALGTECKSLAGN